MYQSLIAFSNILTKHFSENGNIYDHAMIGRAFLISFFNIYDIFRQDLSDTIV